MSDIVTRLLLKTNEFDANLNNAKQSVNGFQSGISSAAQTAGAGIAKFAGAIGLAVGAGETFMKVIRSSQSTSDEFDNVINSCKSSVDSFFASLATGDFSAFNQGISEVISKAYAASAALDQLGNTRMAYNYFGTQTQAKIAEGALLAMDKSLPKSERKQGFDGWKGALNEKKEYSGTMKEDALGALIKTVVEGTVLDANNVTLKDFEKITKLDLQNPAVREKEKEKLDKYFSYYQTNMKALEKKKKGGGLPDWAFPESEGTKERAAHDSILSKEQDKLNEKFKESILYKKILDKWSDEELQHAFNLASEYNKVNEELAMQERAYNKAYDRFSKEKDIVKPGGKVNGAENNTIAPSSSLAYFDAEIAKKSKELINATDAQARSAIQSTVSELEKQKIELLITGKDGSLEALSIQISSLKSKYISATTDEAREEIQKLITDLESKMSYINGKAKAPLKKAGLPTQGYDTKKINPFKTKSPISKKDIKLNEEYNESLAAMGSIMGSLSGAFDGNTQSVLQWGITLLTTIGQAIPAIASMIPIKKQDANASKEEASAAMLNGAAKTVEAHASIPFAGIAIGLAGVASIIAVLSSMPKFATGGIVPGVSFTGDKVPAWLNSGEMILNGGQQSNLFRMLNAGLYAGINAEQVQPSMGNVSRFIMPDESAREIVISGTLRANGSVLETVLNNYTHKKSKVR